MPTPFTLYVTFYIWLLPSYTHTVYPTLRVYYPHVVARSVGLLFAVVTLRCCYAHVCRVYTHYALPHVIYVATLGRALFAGPRLNWALLLQIARLFVCVVYRYVDYVYAFTVVVDLRTLRGRFTLIVTRFRYVRVVAQLNVDFTIYLRCCSHFVHPVRCYPLRCLRCYVCTVRFVAVLRALRCVGPYVYHVTVTICWFDYILYTLHAFVCCILPVVPRCYFVTITPHDCVDYTLRFCVTVRCLLLRCCCLRYRYCCLLIVGFGYCRFYPVVTHGC